MACPSCGAAMGAGAGECGACGLILAKWEERARRQEELVAARALAPAAQPDTQVLSVRQAVLIPAVVFACSGALVCTDLGRFFIHAALAMQVHELGHALMRWFGGLMAVPMPMLTLTFGDERSPWVILVVAGLSLWLLKAAWDGGFWALGVLATCLLLAQATLTWVVPLWRLEFLVAFGGLGAECYVSALLIIAYFHPLPRAARWPSTRVFFLCVGSCVLALSLRRWRDASGDFMYVPWGSFWGGDGDVEAMLGAGWTVNRLVQVYLRTAYLSATAAASQYGFVVWSARDRLTGELLQFSGGTPGKR